MFALSGAVGPIIGQNFGGGVFPRVKETISKALMFAAFYVIAVWCLLAMAHGMIAETFQLTGEGRALLQWFAYLVAPLFFFNGALFIANASFNNLKRPLWSTYLNWARNTLGVAPFAIGGAATITTV